MGATTSRLYTTSRSLLVLKLFCILPVNRTQYTAIQIHIRALEKSKCAIKQTFEYNILSKKKTSGVNI